MSISGCPAIDQLIESSKPYLEPPKPYLEWIPHTTFTDIGTIQSSINHTVYYRYAIHKQPWFDKKIVMVLLGNSDECIPEFIRKFARIYSIPTHEYEHLSDFTHFRRYSKWLERRNESIMGFTKFEDAYYLIAERHFYHYYSLYGFCSACEIFRCSPVWCICGHKELSSGWTSNNEKLDCYIRKSQRQTKSANEAYLEWIPFECIEIISLGSGNNTTISEYKTHWERERIPNWLQISSSHNDNNAQTPAYDTYLEPVPSRVDTLEDSGSNVTSRERTRSSDWDYPSIDQFYYENRTSILNNEIYTDTPEGITNNEPLLNNAIVNNVTRSLPTITRMNNLLDDKNDIEAHLCLTGDLCSGLPASHKVGLFPLDVCDETHALHYYNVSHLL